jgi:hypothetical protein
MLGMEGSEGWRGEGSIKVRFNQGTADVALFDDGGRRTVIRAFPSAVKLFMAQMRAAVSDAPLDAVEERIVVRDVGVSEDVIREAIRLALGSEIATMRAGIIDAIRMEIGKLNLSALTTTTRSVNEPKDSTPTFIPKVNANAKGSIKTTTKTSGGVDDALAALRKKKGN